MCNDWYLVAICFESNYPKSANVIDIAQRAQCICILNQFKLYLSTFISVAPVLGGFPLFTKTRQLPPSWTPYSQTIHSDWSASSNSHQQTWVSCSVALYFSQFLSSHLFAGLQCVVPSRVASLWEKQREAGPLWGSVHPVKPSPENTAGRPVRASLVEGNQPGDTWAPSSGTSRTWQASFGCARRRIFMDTRQMSHKRKMTWLGSF